MPVNFERLTKFKEHHWKMLFDYMKKGLVVPVLGPELLVSYDGDKTSFYQSIKKQLLEHFDMDDIDGESFTDFFIRCRMNNNPDNLVKSTIGEILISMEKEVQQPALEQLADIAAFRLFLTTTPDSLMTRTLRKKNIETNVFWFSSNFQKNNDLPAKNILGPQRYVYHLYGKANEGSEYAILEDERLMFSCKWMDSSCKPQNLSSYLADKYLLILGCGYENWQARFFLYGLKGTGLFNNIWNASSLLADSCTKNDLQLHSFLSRCKGNIYYEGGAIEFVNELSRHLKDNPITLDENDNEIFEENSIFISYASEDREYALKIKKKLEEKCLPVWLDTKQLELGDAYDVKIEKNIRKCSLFLAIISQTTATVIEPRYFRKEWRIAANEALKRTPKVPFICPIAIDDVKPCNNILKEINNVTWEQAPKGVLSETQLNHILELIQQLQEPRHER